LAPAKGERERGREGEGEREGTSSVSCCHQTSAFLPVRSTLGAFNNLFTIKERERAIIKKKEKKRERERVIVTLLE